MSAHGPYSPIYQAGSYYFVSGQIAINPKTKQAAAGIEEQTHQVLKNLQKALSSFELGFDTVVKTTIFLKNIDDFTLVNNVYVQYFAEPRPARSCVEVSALPRIGDNELLIEIEAVAYRQ